MELVCCVGSSVATYNLKIFFFLLEHTVSLFSWAVDLFVTHQMEKFHLQMEMVSWKHIVK